MIRALTLAVLAATLFVPPAGAGERAAACRAQAERLSGYRPHAIEGELGGVRFRLSGSVALGVSRSSGAASPDPPPGAGAAHRDRFEAERNRKRAARYQSLFNACMERNAD